MTNANMQLAVLNVELENKMETPVPKLEVGEHIITRVVEFSRLKDELEGMFQSVMHPNNNLEPSARI